MKGHSSLARKAMGPLPFSDGSAKRLSGEGFCHCGDQSGGLLFRRLQNSPSSSRPGSRCLLADIQASSRTLMFATDFRQYPHRALAGRIADIGRQRGDGGGRCRMLMIAPFGPPGLARIAATAARQPAIRCRSD